MTKKTIKNRMRKTKRPIKNNGKKSRYGKQNKSKKIIKGGALEYEQSVGSELAVTDQQDERDRIKSLLQQLEYSKETYEKKEVRATRLRRDILDQRFKIFKQNKRTELYDLLFSIIKQNCQVITRYFASNGSSNGSIGRVMGEELSKEGFLLSLAKITDVKKLEELTGYRIFPTILSRHNSFKEFNDTIIRRPEIGKNAFIKGTRTKNKTGTVEDDRTVDDDRYAAAALAYVVFKGKFTGSLKQSSFGSFYRSLHNMTETIRERTSGRFVKFLSEAGNEATLVDVPDIGTFKENLVAWCQTKCIDDAETNDIATAIRSTFITTATFTATATRSTFGIPDQSPLVNASLVQNDTSYASDSVIHAVPINNNYSGIPAVLIDDPY